MHPVSYISTRGQAPALAFDDVVLSGLARDGGLYLPQQWPCFSVAEWEALRGRSYTALAAAILKPFMGDSSLLPQLPALIERGYQRFRHQAIAPLVQLDTRLWLLELFHGPTYAFKDYALQVLGEIFDALLQQSNEQVTILGATSGDTGSAAIEACRDKPSMRVFILHPHGRVSDVQRRQMTTVPADNIHNLAIEGTFDDCQRIVKELFGNLAFRDAAKLTAVNSINWARILTQVVYYAAAALALGAPQRAVAVAVPTGNFGNIFAATVARAMGLPIAKFIIGTNHNDILTRFFTSGIMATDSVQPSLSPSMDIQVSSNFERLLFTSLNGDAGHVASLMTQFQQTGQYHLPNAVHQRLAADFTSVRASNADTLAVMKAIYDRTGQCIDPHTAVGIHAAQTALPDLPDDMPVISLACAHPAKFPDAVTQAIGKAPEQPASLAVMADMPERFTRLPATALAVRNYIEKH